VVHVAETLILCRIIAGSLALCATASRSRFNFIIQYVMS
jgi:hypothetical protein